MAIKCSVWRTFYPRLHQAYRLLPQSEMPHSDEEKKRLFIYMTSKVAGQNLIPFFEEWGLTPNDDIREKIEKSKLPKLEKEIGKLQIVMIFVRSKLNCIRFRMVNC